MAATHSSTGYASGRRNYFIRCAFRVLGDLAVSSALAASCVWIIESAALGVFMSFLVWLLAFAAWLALSQLVVHPLVSAVLCDRKLDQGIAWSVDTVCASTELAQHLWRLARSTSLMRAA